MRIIKALLLLVSYIILVSVPTQAQELYGIPTKYTDIYGNRIYDYGPYEGLSYEDKIRLITGGEKSVLSRNEPESWCRNLVTTVKVPCRDMNNKPTWLTLTVNKYLAYSVISTFDDIYYNTTYKLASNTTGAYCYRYINGTNKLSFHAYGSAIDVNWDANPQSHNLPPESPVALRSSSHPVVKLFNKYDWGWGGAWTGTTPDYMHFSYTDE